MPNEIRPCTLWGETFDALKVHSVTVTLELMRKEEIVLVRVRDEEEGFIYIKHPTSSNHKEADLLQEAITTIANALNAPVTAMEEVLAGLPQGSDFLAHKVGYSPMWQSAFYCPESQQWWSEDEPLDESYIIKSDGCSKTLQVLLQFTLDGVWIKEGG